MQKVRVPPQIAWPLAVVEASGAYFTDADGTRYLDYHAAFGPLILGHNHPQVNAAVRKVAPVFQGDDHRLELGQAPARLLAGTHALVNCGQIVPQTCPQAH